MKKLIKRIKGAALSRKLRRTEERLSAVESMRDELTEEIYSLLRKRRGLQYKMNKLSRR